jgi:hypothetical protein
MKIKTITAVSIFVLCLIFTGFKQGHSSIGLGIIVGEPTGFSIKIGKPIALGVAWSFNNHFHIHADYWIINSVLASPVDWFLGVGGKFTIKSSPKESSLNVGFRIPVGMQWFFAPQFELFAEIAPGFMFIPETAFDIGGGIGIRFYIGK